MANPSSKCSTNIIYALTEKLLLYSHNLCSYSIFKIGHWFIFKLHEDVAYQIGQQLIIYLKGFYLVLKIMFHIQ